MFHPSPGYKDCNYVKQEFHAKNDALSHKNVKICSGRLGIVGF